MPFAVRAGLVSLACAYSLLADGLVPPLSPSQAEEARKLLESFKKSPRGPYQRIRWFCKDGSVLPPAGTPCKDRGGGNQHAELNDGAKKLAGWNIHAGTVLTGLDYEALADRRHDHHWLKELVIEKHLVETDQGWVYRKAASYRGARQIEDEEKAGRALLAKLFAEPDWVARNYFLALQLASAIPHGVADSTVRRIRNLAVAAANADPRFQRIRAKIHSYPGPEDEASVRKFLQDSPASEQNKPVLDELLALLSKHYGKSSWAPEVRKAAQNFSGTPLERVAVRLLDAAQAYGDSNVLEPMGDMLLAIRRQASASSDGRRNLQLLDLGLLLIDQSQRLRRPVSATTRAEWLADLKLHFRLAAGAGLLSMRQLEALGTEADLVLKSGSIAAAEYRVSIRHLGRSMEWCRATVAKDFGPAAAHYAAVEPGLTQMVDYLVRGSVALSLSSTMDVLLTDADRAAGIRHTLLGRKEAAGVAGLNPGVMTGRLFFLDPLEGKEQNIDPRGLYVIPESASDLKPMAGMLTLDAGNLLSHAQLLAANLGIPNARIPSALLPALREHEGQEMFFAVTPRQVVILKPKSELTPRERALWGDQPAQSLRQRIRLDTSRLKLGDRTLRMLTELDSSDAGVTAGPKAANLGQLAGYFPERVAPGVVIPFGVFEAHVNRDLDGSGVPLLAQVRKAMIEAERMRESGASPEDLQKYIYPKLAHFRTAIQKMPVLDSLSVRLREMLARHFGPDGTYGVFVRSDTNAEDLPGFTGAGLNLTAANQVGWKQIEQAIKNVWASPYTERAYDWRSRALIGAENVYPSVIVMRTVRSEKSGVIATVDLETGRDNYVTVNASEGVSAVVDGGVAESLLLGPDGSQRLLQQCRATYRKVCRADGGFENIPAVGADVLLTPGDVAQLRAVVAEVNRKYPPALSASGSKLPWDIEFGFEGGKLWLFQIRPLARFQEMETLDSLAKLEGAVGRQPVKIQAPLLQ